MGRFIFWVISVAVSLALGAMLPAAIRAMAQSAASAFEHDQMSYAKFSRELTGVQKRHH